MRYPTLAGPAHRTQALGSQIMMAKHFAQGTSGGILGTVGSAAWPAANRVIYLPFELDQPVRVTEFWTFNGTGAVSGNWDFGIYDEFGTRLMSTGAVAQAGVNQSQLLPLGTPVLIGRGAFYLAMVASSGTLTVYRFNGGVANDWLVWGALQEASVFPLPPVAVFAGNQTAFLPFGGLSAKLT